MIKASIPWWDGAESSGSLWIFIGKAAHANPEGAGRIEHRTVS